MKLNIVNTYGKKLSLILISAIMVNALVAPALFAELTSADSSNLIANPQVETAAGANPADWQVGNWGTNTITTSYLNSGPTGDSNSVSINMTSYTDGDAKWYFNPVNVNTDTQYTFSDTYEATTATDVVVAYTMTDGTNQYVDLGEQPASATWQTFSDSFVAPDGVANATIYHRIDSVGSLTTSNFSMTASTTPTIDISAPIGSSEYSPPFNGSVPLTAQVTDIADVSSVQFQIDGTNVGTPVTAKPYTYNWNSISTTNGTHEVSAVATETNGTTIDSAAVGIEVSNTSPATGNLVPNPLMSTVDPSNPSMPQDWQVDSWGTNTFTSTYEKTGSTGDPYSGEINMTSYTDGDAKWVFTPQNVAQDTQYDLNEYYESNVQTQIDAVFTMSDGSTEYQIIGLPYVANTWTDFNTKFSVPAGATNVAIYHIIEAVGTLSVDNVSLTPYTPTGFSSAIATLTFDDGYETEYANALPILKQDGFDSTQYIITDLIGQSGYMTAAQLKAFYQDGDEMASHTVTHDDLTQETASALSKEMTQSKTTIEADTGETSVPDMAYPYGLYNANVMASAKANYSAARGVESGLNSKDNYNPYDLKVEDVYDTTTTAQIADWVAQAQAANAWIIFVYHGVDADTTNPVDGDIYNVTPTQLTDQLAAIKASGITVDTLSKALSVVDPQAGITPPPSTPTPPVVTPPAAKTYTVTFNANGGTGTMAAETESTKTALTTNRYTRSGYTFASWNTKANGSGTSYANKATYAFTANTTLYAQWTKTTKYTVASVMETIIDDIVNFI